MERACNSCLDVICQKKHILPIFTCQKKPANEKYQMLPYYEGKYEHKLNIIDFESVKKVL